MAYSDNIELLCDVKGETLDDIAKLVGTDKDTLLGYLDNGIEFPKHWDKLIADHFGIEIGVLKHSGIDDIPLMSSSASSSRKSIKVFYSEAFSWSTFVIPLALAFFFSLWTIGEYLSCSEDGTMRLMLICLSVGFFLVSIFYPAYRFLSYRPKKDGPVRAVFYRSKVSISDADGSRDFPYSYFENECGEGSESFFLAPQGKPVVVVPKGGLSTSEVVFIRRVLTNAAGKYVCYSDKIPSSGFKDETSRYAALSSVQKHKEFLQPVLAISGLVLSLGLSGLCLAKIYGPTGWAYGGISFLVFGLLGAIWPIISLFDIKNGHKLYAWIALGVSIVSALVGIVLMAVLF